MGKKQVLGLVHAFLSESLGMLLEPFRLALGQPLVQAHALRLRFLFF